ncbi:hypothetical protein PHOSAC3_120639 [Mesotoga infera]|nr:hypothetical protein PHOSAC3_120639 [Mesotoga infera]
MEQLKQFATITKPITNALLLAGAGDQPAPLDAGGVECESGYHTFCWYLPF